MTSFRYNFASNQDVPEPVPATLDQLMHFRVAAIVMASIVIIGCILCIVVIKKNISVDFSLKVIALIIVINLGFLLN